MVDRENTVKASFENAESINHLADERLTTYEKKIAEIEGEGREIIKNAKIKADAQAKTIIDQANDKALTMIKKADEEIQREQHRAIAEMKTQIAGLAILAAERILEKKLDFTGQEEMITGIIEEAGKSEWRN